MLEFDLIGLPDVEAAVAKLGPARDLELVVVYHGDLSLRDFLSRILGAAGYKEPGSQLHLLEWPAGEGLDLVALLRRLGTKRVMLFGYELPRLGIHFRVANYVPLEVGGIHYLVADSLEFISERKEAGDNQAAGALWNAIRQGFLYE